MAFRDRADSTARTDVGATCLILLGHGRTRPVRPLIESTAIAERVRVMGAKISEDYADKSLVVVGVLTGCFVFMADLVRSITVPLECEFIGLSSYGSASESSGVVAITKDLNRSIEQKDVLVVEDIVDTGLTMNYLLDNLRTRRPASLRIASLLSKPARRRVDVGVDYLGFTIEDRFVVGYGMDKGGYHRNLPYLAYVD